MITANIQRMGGFCDVMFWWAVNKTNTLMCRQRVDLWVQFEGFGVSEDGFFCPMSGGGGKPMF